MEELPDLGQPIRSRHAATDRASWLGAGTRPPHPYLPLPPFIPLPETVPTACSRFAAQPNMAALTVCSAAACRAHTVRASAQKPKVSAMGRARSLSRQPGEEGRCRWRAAAGGGASRPPHPNPKPASLHSPSARRRTAGHNSLMDTAVMSWALPSHRPPSPRCRAWLRPWVPQRCCSPPPLPLLAT